LFLREAEAAGRAMDACVARRSLGVTSLFQGEIAFARACLEQALAEHEPERDTDARRLFGTDSGVTPKAFLALAAWLTGETERARKLIEQAVREGHESGDAATVATAYLFLMRLEATRDDPAATLSAGEALLRFAADRDMAIFPVYAQIFSSWARGRLHDPGEGAEALRQALQECLAQGARNGAPSFYGMIAELEALAGRAESALRSIDQALALAEETGERWTDPVLLRLKGEILRIQDPAAAEEAFQAALASARRQASRCLALRAALSLASLHRSGCRLADAYAVLAPALEGFEPSPNMPEIAEAQLLLEQLAQEGRGAVARS
jgi:predicted ATPase